MPTALAEVTAAIQSSPPRSLRDSQDANRETQDSHPLATGDVNPRSLMDQTIVERLEQAIQTETDERVRLRLKAVLWTCEGTGHQVVALKIGREMGKPVSTATIRRWCSQFETGGPEALVLREVGRPSLFSLEQLASIRYAVKKATDELGRGLTGEEVDERIDWVMGEGFMAGRARHSLTKIRATIGLCTGYFVGSEHPESKSRSR